MNQNYAIITLSEERLFFVTRKEHDYTRVLFAKDASAFSNDSMTIIYSKIKLLNEMNKIWPL